MIYKSQVTTFLKSLVLIKLLSLSSVSFGVMISVELIHKNEVGSMEVDNPFNGKKNLIIWGKKGGVGEIPGEYKKEFMEFNKYMGNGSFHINNINYIDKGHALGEGSVAEINVVVDAVDWLGDIDEYREKIGINDRLLNSFLIYHELSHVKTEMDKESTVMSGEIMADIDAVEYISTNGDFTNKEILNLVEYLILMRSIRFVCCGDFFHYSGQEMEIIRKSIIDNS